MSKKSKVLNAEDELSYRMPMKVEEELVFLNGHTFSVSPRCKISMEREYQSYCDRCGQCLDWSDFGNAKARWALSANMMNGNSVYMNVKAKCAHTISCIRCVGEQSSFSYLGNAPQKELTAWGHCGIIVLKIVPQRRNRNGTTI